MPTHQGQNPPTSANLPNSPASASTPQPPCPQRASPATVGSEDQRHVLWATAGSGERTCEACCATPQNRRRPWTAPARHPRKQQHQCECGHPPRTQSRRQVLPCPREAQTGKSQLSLQGSGVLGKSGLPAGEAAGFWGPERSAPAGGRGQAGKEAAGGAGQERLWLPSHSCTGSQGVTRRAGPSREEGTQHVFPWALGAPEISDVPRDSASSWRGRPS